MSKALHSISTRPGLASEAGLYGLIGLATLLVSLLVLVGLPQIGLSGLTGLLSPVTFFLLSGGLVGGFVYLHYLKWTLSEPQRLFILAVLSFDLFIFTLNHLEAGLGVSLKVTTLASLLYIVPMVLLILFSRGHHRLGRIPLVPCMLGFFAVTVIYYLFYNQHAVDLAYRLADRYSPIAWTRIIALFNLAVLMLAASRFLQTLPRPEVFFDRFNKYYLVLVVIFSVLGLIFYPLDLFTEFIETRRMALFFMHPNSFAYFLSLALCFLAGSAFYYLKRHEKRKATLIFLSLPVILLCLTTCGSKSSLIISALAVFLIVALEAILERQRFPLFKLFQHPGRLIVVTGLLVATIVSASALGVLDNLKTRFSDHGSASWRVTQWERVMANTNPERILVGHGHTAALMITQRYVYNTWNIRGDTQESAYVHNALLEHVYDYGVFGLLWLAGLLICLAINLHGLFFGQLPARFRSLHIACIGTSLVLLSGLFFEECFYTLSPVSFWFLWLLQFYMASLPQFSPSTVTGLATGREANRC